MPYFDLRPDLITVLLQNNLTRIQLILIILNCIGISDRSQHPQDLKAVLFNMKLIAFPCGPYKKWYVISMQTATTGLICLRQLESVV